MKKKQIKRKIVINYKYRRKKNHSSDCILNPDACLITLSSTYSYTHSQNKQKQKCKKNDCDSSPSNPQTKTKIMKL